MKVEFAPVDSPKYNGVVERGFATLYGRVRASLNAAGFFGKKRHLYWAECANTCTKIDDILAYKKGVPSKFFGEDMTGYKQHLHPFGELAVVTTGGKKKLKAKLEDRRKLYFMAGYAENHAGNVFRMINVKTGKLTETRDVYFLGVMYGEIFDPENFIAYKKGREKALEKEDIKQTAIIEVQDEEGYTSREDNDYVSDDSKDPEEEYEESFSPVKRSVNQQMIEIEELEQELQDDMTQATKIFLGNSKI